MKRNHLLSIIIVLITVSFLISTIISFRTINSTVMREYADMTMLLAENIYSDIDMILQRHINVGQTIANSKEFIDLFENEDQYSQDEMEELMIESLGRYTKNLDYDTAFVISDKSGKYYSQQGFNKVLSPETDEHDVWYSNFLAKNEEYEFNLDTDQVSDDEWTIFLNVRMLDENGDLVGVCGIGSRMASIQNIITRMQAAYDLKVHIVDQDGTVKLNGKDMQLDQSIYENLKLGDDGSHTLIKKTADGYLVTKYLRDLGWTLVIEHQVNKKDMLMELVTKNMLVMIGIFFVLIVGSTLLIRKGSKSMEELAKMDSYGALASVYEGMYIMDARNDSVREIKNVFGNDLHIFDVKRSISSQIMDVGDDYIEPESRQLVHEFMNLSTLEARLADKDTVACEFKSKPLGWCRMHFIAIRDDRTRKIDYYLFAIEVIDDEVKAQQALELETQEAKAASEAKGRFLANMSHEIRTPINAVLGMDIMILRECKEPKTREYALAIQNAGRTLLSIINDILDFSKIESGKMEIIPIEYDLSSLINDVVNMNYGRMMAKHLDFHLEVDENLPSVLYGDDVRIRQILTNIMSNAFKYTEKGSVTFTVTGTRMGNEILLHFSVKDTGIGIKEEDLEKLFQNFERIEESRNRNIEGTGLGMNITKQLLEMMGSKLVVNSVYGEGSEFSFDLLQIIRNEERIGNLAERIAERAVAYKYEASFEASEAKVLIVDDNETNRMVFCNLLKETKLQIEEASGGRMALEKIENEKFDIIFLDHMMPDMDGIQVVQEMKKSKTHSNQDTPVIMLTANAIAGSKEEYMAAGFDDYLSKPIIPERLEKMIAKWLPEDKKERATVQNEQPDGNANWSGTGKANEGVEFYAENGTNLNSEWNAGEGRKSGESHLDSGMSDLAEEELPIIEGIDWDYARLHLPRREMLLSTIKTFYHTIDLEADELAEYYGIIATQENAGDALEPFREQVATEALEETHKATVEDALNQFRVKVHAMKSNATLLGFLPIGGMALGLEMAAKDGDMDFIQNVTPHFLTSWRSYKKKLRDLVEPQEKIEKKQVDDKTEIIDYLKQVIETTLSFDVHGADAALEHLMKYEFPDEIAQLMEKLEAAVNNLDTDKVESWGNEIIAMVTEKM